MKELLRDARVVWVEGHMCQFGMVAPITGSHGHVGRVKKPTGFLSSSRYIAAELNRYCDGSHDHVHLMSGKAAAAQEYPPALCKAILRGLVKQKAADESSRVTTTPMTQQKTRNFIRSLSNVCLSKVSDLVEDVCAGRVPGHWQDTVHEEDGGYDDRGTRPHLGYQV